MTWGKERLEVLKKEEKESAARAIELKEHERRRKELDEYARTKMFSTEQYIRSVITRHSTLSRFFAPGNAVTNPGIHMLQTLPAVTRSIDD